MTLFAACDALGNCRKVDWVVDSPEDFRPVTIQASVGAGGTNRAEDVKAIQRALNRVSADQGGPAPALDVDGFYGPKTGAAIRQFQKRQFPGWSPDGRIDPDQKTLKRLNELLGSTSKQAFRDPAAVHRSDAAETDPGQIEQAVKLASDALSRVRRAKNRLAAVRATFALPDTLASSQQEKRLVAWHFKAHKARDPVTQIDRVMGIYQRMEETLFMSLRHGTSFRLFQPGHHPDPTAIAYAHWGGFEAELSDTEEGERVRYIYITPKFRTTSSSVIIHELGHFCGGRKGSHREIGHIASPQPGPHGEPRDDSKTGHNYAQLTADEAFCNTYSYQVYAFPEFKEHRVPDSFRF
ncbi:MAG: peptidoglycan-binding protein [Pirellulaceae bacterium]